MTGAKEQKSEGEVFIASFFTTLNEVGISYRVVGSNVTSLPAVPDNDIDIIFPNNEVTNVLQVISDISQRTNAQLAQQLWHEHGAYYSVVWVEDKSGGMFVKLDICGDYLRGGRQFLTAQWLLEGWRNISASGVNILIASPEREFGYYLLKKIDKGYIDREALGHLSNLFIENQRQCTDVLINYWSNNVVSDIGDALRDHDYGYFKSHIGALQETLRSNIALPTPALLMSELIRRLTRIFQPTGMVTVILGPDGSGKSTLLTELIPRCASFGRNSDLHHLWPNISGSNNSVEIVTDPHGKEPRGMFTSVVKLFFLIARYNVGWVKSVFWLYRCSSMIWFDRYYHDILADPLRYRMGAPLWLVRLVGKFIPKPDLFLVLDVVPEVARARKTEVPEEESQRQFHAYRALAEELPNAVLIDANGTPEGMASACERAVVEAMAKRLEIRNRRFVSEGGAA